MAGLSNGLVADPLTRLITKRSADKHAAENPDKRHKTQDLRESDTSRHVTLENGPEDSFGASPGVVEVFEEEEEDRFFGGGLTAQQAEALDFIEANDKEADYGPAVSLDLTGLRKQAARFEKAITKNQRMRTRHVDDPTRFLESEAELDQEIKDLNVLSEYPHLLKDFIDMGCLASLIGLFGHENSDIACDAIQVLDEITDEDTNPSEDQVLALVDGLKSCTAIESLVQNLARLKEEITEERDAIFKSMSILENIVNMNSNLKEYIFSETSLCDWLLMRIKQADEVGFSISENKQYAAELLSILAQDSSTNIETLIAADTIDSILMLLAPYRKKDPDKGSTEEEYLENLFDILDTLVTLGEGKDKFIEGEGVELMQRLLVDARSPETRLRALKCLEYACDSWSGGAVCQQMVEVGLLRSLFATFMKKDDHESVKTCLGIFVSFFRTLNDGEAERIRVINKFVENKCAKTERLLQLRKVYHTKHHEFWHKNIANRKGGSSLAEYTTAEVQFMDYLDRLDNGLDILQLIDTLLAWLIASDHTIATHLEESGQIEYKMVRETLDELIETLRRDDTEQSADEDKSVEDVSNARQEREMLEAIVAALPESTDRKEPETMPSE